MNKYSLRSFALLWMSIFIVSFLVFLYIILNLFFSEHITRSSLKDLRYAAHVAKLTLSEEQERMKNTLALHVSSPEFIGLLQNKDFERVNRFIGNWKSLLKIESIQLYNNAGELIDLESGVASADRAVISEERRAKLNLGYEQTHYVASEKGLSISIQRKIIDQNYIPQGYLIEKKEIPYEFFLKDGASEELIVRSHQGVVYTTPGVQAASKIPKKVFAKGAGAFELSLRGRVFDVFRVDLVPGVTFFMAKKNLKEVVFQSFYKKYLLYFVLLIIFLVLVFYVSYYKQVFKPLEGISKFIVRGEGELGAETSVFEISLIAKKLEEKISELSSDVEKSEQGRVDDMSRLVASVAHELNNSLSYLGGNLEYLRDELKESDKIDFEDFKDAVSSAQSGYERIKKIVSDLRVFSSKREFSIAWHKIVELKSRVEDEFESVEISFPQEIKEIEIETDLDRSFQIIKNLIVNAQQAYQEGEKLKKVLVSFYVEGDNFVIAVRDWAGGIPMEVMGKVFEPFYTTKKNTGGAGLGLALSRNLAKEMGAELVLKNTGEEGAVFCFKVRRFM
ncbi:MAG: sensor histidine kinase [Bdellovibrionales bacterium]